MPNWCHNTLTVEGPKAKVQVFVDRVATNEQPLTFTAHAPEPSAEVYAAMDAAASVTCYLCGGLGRRPTTAEEAKAQGARWEPEWASMEWLQEMAQTPVAERRSCNGCDGKGERVEHPSWYTWRINNWGTKWDASFDGPAAALGTAEADVDASVAANGRMMFADIAIYKFQTAWGPPTAWLVRAGAEHPDLTLKLLYGEPGIEFAGEIVVHGKKVTDRELSVEEVLAADEMWF